MSDAGKKGDRITVAEVRAAYAATGLGPSRGVWLDGPGSWDGALARVTCGCPATVVAAVRSGSPANYLACLVNEVDEGCRRAALAELGVSDHYLWAFTQTVDGEDGPPWPDQHDYRAGVEDGAAVRAALWPEASA